MSASLLPSELWRSIFRHAVHVPLLLDVNWDYEPEERLWAGWGSTDDDLIATRQAIVQVCREWKEMGSEFLYEVVCIPNLDDEEYDQVDILVEAFKASATQSKLGYGWWTKRITCPISLFNSERHVDRLFALLEQCHNLEIFTIPTTSRADVLVQNRLAHILQSRFSHSLRRVDLFLNIPSDTVPIDHTSVLPDVRLTSLGMDLREPFLDRPMHPSFESVTTLTLYLPFEVNKAPHHIFFPRLKALAVLHLSASDFPAVRSFIEQHHGTLINLHVQTTEANIPNIPLLVSGHPKVQTLTFDDQDLVNLGGSILDGMDPMIGITYLGIIRTRPDATAGRIKDGVQDVLGRGLPDLRVVRLLSQIPPFTTDVETWMEVIKICEDFNVRLEDKHGQLVKVEVDA